MSTTAIPSTRPVSVVAASIGFLAAFLVPSPITDAL
jgi:hypothetical protein